MRSRAKTACAAGIIGLIVAACGGTNVVSQPASSATSSPASSAPAATPTPTPTATPQASLQSLWCGLSLGQSKTAIEAVMGASDPTMDQEAAQIIASEQSLLPAGASAEVWLATNGDSFWATFNGSNNAINLQAYQASSMTQPASDLTCQAFRNSS